MSEFKPITTQEELDSIIGERLKRQKESISKQYTDYEELKTKNVDLEKELTELKKSLESSTSSKTELEKQIEELTGKVKAHDLSSLKIKYALENGIPYNLAGRISGDDEESIKADAQSLSDFFKSQTPPPPLKNTETNTKGEDVAYQNILKGLKGE
ncbi:capsid assembly scaffolding protein Gp46 family protein [Parvimonas micra]